MVVLSLLFTMNLLEMFLGLGCYLAEFELLQLGAGWDTSSLYYLVCWLRFADFAIVLYVAFCYLFGYVDLWSGLDFGL